MFGLPGFSLLYLSTPHLSIWYPTHPGWEDTLCRSCYSGTCVLLRGLLPDLWLTSMCEPACLFLPRLDYVIYICIYLSIYTICMCISRYHILHIYGYCTSLLHLALSVLSLKYINALCVVLLEYFNIIRTIV